MRPLRLFLALSIFVAASVIYRPHLSLAEDSSSIILGALLPLSGTGADQGQWSKRGFQIAEQELAAAGILHVKLRVEDTAGDAKTAVSAFHLLRARYNVPVVFTWGSGIAMALSPVVNKHAVIQMGIATGTPDYRAVGDFNFRNFHSLSDEGKFLATAVRKRFPSAKVVSIAIENDYGLSAASVFRDEFSSLGGELEFAETVRSKETDFRSLLRKLLSVQPEVVFLAVYPSEGALLLRQLRELNFKGKVVASGAIVGAEDFFALTGDAAEGALIAVPDPGDSAVLRTFKRRYKEMFQQEHNIADFFSVRAYDALQIVNEAVGQCSEGNSECIRRALFNIHDFPGAAGKITFDEAGDVAATFKFITISGRQFVEELSAK